MKYSPQTGMMYKSPKDCSKNRPYDAGPIINRDAHGYKRIGYKGKTWKQHRLAFLLMGEPVPPYVDHVDGDRNNNAWNNLQPITLEENSRKRKDNTSGVNGVKKYHNKWKATYQHQKVRHYLGLFETIEAATEAIEKFKERL